jgi:oligopeptidase B
MLPSVNKKYFGIIFGIFAFLSCQNNEIMPPKAKLIPKQLVSNGVTRVDNFYWLKDKKNSDVINYLKAENEYVNRKMETTQGLQDTIFNEIVNRLKPEDKTVPYKENEYFYYERFETGKEQPIHCRKRDSLTAPEEIFLDVNALSEGYPYYEIGDYTISPDNQFAAYAVDTVGTKQYSVFFKNLKTGEILKDKIINAADAPVWADDNKTLFYVKLDKKTLREFQVYSHVLGTKPGEDKLVYQEEYDEFTLSLHKSKSGKYVFINSEGNSDNEILYIRADKPKDKFKIFQKRTTNILYRVEECDNKYYILTNYNARNFRVMVADENKTSIENWHEFESHSDKIFIEDFEVFKDFIVLNERKDGLTLLKVINLTDKSSYFIDFKEEAYDVWISDNDDPESHMLRYGYCSLTTPTSYIDFNLKTQKKYVLKQQEVIGKFSKDNYEIKRLHAVAPDGTQIPISVVYKRGLKKDGKNPLLITGYGAYGENPDLNFNSSDLCLLDRGFVIAIAHVRGGQELGREWYNGGKLLNKKNSFTDFIACTEFLQKENYSQPAFTFALGASAGGLLVGAAANMRPELFRGIVAEVPFVDIVTTMLDKSLPLTAGEFDEWGDPSKKNYFDYMLSYSPYDQVQNQAYPAMFVTAGLFDTQVPYWEPAKWVAKLRLMNTGQNPIYLHTNLETGHDGASGRFATYKETAMIYAFMIDLLRK